jgi:hypothetical protein
VRGLHEGIEQKVSGNRAQRILLNLEEPT